MEQEVEVTDPVCGMSFDAAEADGSLEHDGRMYYFCNPGCLAKFKADPEKYLSKAPKAAGRGPQTADRGAPAAASCCSHGAHEPAPAASSTRVVDPVCGMSVSVQSPHSAVHEGQDFFF